MVGASGPFTDELHAYTAFPPLVGVAVNVTGMPAQIVVPGFTVSVTVGTAVPLTTTV